MIKQKQQLLLDEQMPVIAKKLYTSVERDFEDFQDKENSIFNDTFLNHLETLTYKAEMQLSPEKKNQTRDVLNQYQELEQQINAMAVFLSKRNNSLNRQLIDIIIVLREAIISKKKKEIVKHTRILLNKIKENQYVLLQNGLEPAAITSIDKVHNNIQKVNTINEIMPYTDIFDALWSKMKTICITGQALYKHADPARAKQYSFKCLKEEYLFKIKNKKQIA